MNIFYIGKTAADSTSGHRFEALKRIGHNLFSLDLDNKLSAQLSGNLLHRIHNKTGYRFLQQAVCQEVSESILSAPSKIDAIWINSGELLGKTALSMLKKIGAPILLYNNDDPTSGRDGRRWGSLFQALPLYDFCAVRLDSDHSEFISLGAKRIMPVWMSYDEVAHAPIPDLQESQSIDVAFVGTWMKKEHREVILRALVDSNIKVAILGGRWELSPDKQLVRNCWEGGAVAGFDYVKAIANPKLTLGLVSKTNRDSHTQRSLEVPYAGGVLFAERTDDHLRLYRDNEEAVFWSTPEECVEKCKILLGDKDKRLKIRMAGMRRVRQIGLGNEETCRKILDACLHSSETMCSMPAVLHPL